MHKLAFDLRTRELAGIYRYGSSLLNHLGHLLAGPDIHLYVLYKPEIQRQVDDVFRYALPHDLVEFILVPDQPGRIPDSPWLRNWLVNTKIQVYYSIDFVVDIRCPIQFIYTIHDLIPLKFPEYFYNDTGFIERFGMDEFNRIRRDLQKVKSYAPKNFFQHRGEEILSRYSWAVSHYLAQHSKHIVTVTEAVREDVVNYLSVPPSKVSVISGAADPTYFYPRGTSEIKTTIQKFGLTQGYCLYVGRNLRHKRISWLLETLAHHRNDLPQGSKIVIVCDETNFTQLYELIMFYRLEHLIVLTGRVSDDELACLYSGARALVISSIDEGFCLPAVEALTCRTEVIVPDTKVLREVTKSYGHFYDVHDENQLAGLVIQSLKGELTSKALHFKNPFTWERSAQQLLNLFLSTLEKG